MPKQPINALGARIKALRQASGWTRAQLAQKAGVHRGTVENYELRPIPLSLQNLENIAKALNTTPQDLAGWTKEGEAEHGKRNDADRNREPHPCASAAHGARRSD